MTPAPTDIAEASGVYDAPLCGWHCFHCGDEFSVAKQGCWEKAIAAAKEHFGLDARWTPACIEFTTMKPRKMYRRMRRAEIKIAQIGHDAEELDDLRSRSYDQSVQLTAALNRIDSLEGELEVERLRLREGR